VKTVEAKKFHCRTCTVDQRTLFCNDAVVATATTQVVLDQHQTFYARLLRNSFAMIFSAKNYASLTCFNKVAPKNCRGPVFSETRCRLLDLASCEPVRDMSATSGVVAQW